MDRDDFSRGLRRHIDEARKTWLASARSDDPERPGFIPLLIVRTKRAERIVPLPGFGRSQKGKLLAKAGFLFFQRYQEKPRAIFVVAESWIAPATEKVMQHVSQGGGLTDLKDDRSEVLSVIGLRPDGTGNAAYVEIHRSRSGEAALGDTVVLPEDDGLESAPTTLHAFYDGYRRARAARR